MFARFLAFALAAVFSAAAASAEDGCEAVLEKGIFNTSTYNSDVNYRNRVDSFLLYTAT